MELVMESFIKNRFDLVSDRHSSVICLNCFAFIIIIHLFVNLFNKNSKRTLCEQAVGCYNSQLNSSGFIILYNVNYHCSTHFLHYRYLESNDFLICHIFANSTIITEN